MQALLEEEALAIEEYERSGDARRLDEVHAKMMHVSDVSCIRQQWQAESDRFEADGNVRLRLESERREGRRRAPPPRSTSPTLDIAIEDDSDDDDLSVEDIGRWDGVGAPAVKPKRVAEAGELDLKPHQLDGVRFVRDRFAQGKGAIIAFSMGLGKTLTALAVVNEIEIERCLVPGAGERQLRVVVLCPSILTFAWKAEHEKFEEHMLLRMHEPTTSSEEVCTAIDAWEREGGTLVVSFTVLMTLASCRRKKARDCCATLHRCAEVLIVDELHMVKNDETKRAQAITGFETRRRLGLTGTPMQNNPLEYYKVVRMVDEGALSMSSAEFDEEFAKPIMEAQYFDAPSAVQLKGRAQASVVRAMLRHVVIHRSSTLLREMLPPKTEYMLAYHYPESCKFEQSKDSKGRVCYFGQQAKVDEAVRPVKVDLVVAMLQCIRGSAAIVFSEHPATLRALRAKLFSGSELIHGETPIVQRKNVLQAFERAEFDTLLLSIGTCSTGINCQRASYVILMDPSENPARDTQAVCRAWRIGQAKPVTVYRLAAMGTIDVRVMRRGMLKLDAAHNVMHSDSRASSNVMREEMVAGKRARDDDAKSAPASIFLPASECADAVVRAVAERLHGWSMYDTFYVDVEDARTDEWAAIDECNRRSNKRGRMHTRQDGTTVLVPEDVAVLEDGELVAPPIPIIRNEAKRTLVQVAPHYDDRRFCYEIAYRKGESAPWEVNPVRMKHYLLTWQHAEALGELEDGGSIHMQIRSRVVMDERVGPWSPPSAPFADRMVR